VGSWGEFRDLLAARRRVIAYDRRGFTAAAPEPAEDMKVNAADAESILRRARAAPAEIVGWSAGGLVALALAVEHPETCRSLLLIEPSVHGMRALTPSAVWMSLRSQLAKLRGRPARRDRSLLPLDVCVPRPRPECVGGDAGRMAGGGPLSRGRCCR
jgi:pimeloyl-ACP methyl ester carboxylesterase